MIINHNLSAMFASRIEGINNHNLQLSMEKLSSGQRINKASDDAANLAVSEKMRAQIRGLNKASENAQNGVNFIQTTSGYLEETTEILQRIRELAVQASNGLYSAEDRMQIQVEVSQLVAEVDRIASVAQFNGMQILTGRFAADADGNGEKMSFHIGANMDQNISINIASATANALGLRGEGQDGSNGNLISVEDAESANMALGTIDEALKTVNRQRANLGAVQNRMEIAVKGINIAAENLQASESRIRDADMAKESVEFVKNQILQQSSMAVLAQANSRSADVLSLLR